MMWLRNESDKKEIAFLREDLACADFELQNERNGENKLVSDFDETTSENESLEESDNQCEKFFGKSNKGK
jgi:hypothetical protein